jgi:Sulfotransferase domain
MTLKVLGAGFGRTGTLSLKIALEMLGVGRCYHMMEVFQNPGHADMWSNAADGNVDWETLLAGYTAAVDWPSTYFWRELANYYPDSKIILTHRSTQSWIKSVKETIFGVIGTPTPDDKPHLAAQKSMAQKIVTDRTFGGNIEDDAHLAAVYEKHFEEVRRTIPAERLLVYQVGDGWQPLCNFLGIPVPAVEYPKVNSTEEFKNRVAILTGEK